MIPDIIDTTTPQNRPAVYILLNFQQCWIVITMPRKQQRYRQRKPKADRPPCDCWNDCDGEPIIHIGQNITRYLWQGCKRTGGRGGENRHNIFLWKEHTQNGNLVNEQQRPAYMKWRHLFDIKPDIATETVRSIMDLGGSISNAPRSIMDLGGDE